MTTGDKPVVAVLAGEPASLTPAEVLVAAADLARICFLLDSREASPPLRAVCESLAPTATVDFTDPTSCLNAVREAGASVVATFTDVLCPLVAVLNRLLAGQSSEGTLWGRKDAQRAALFAAGLSAVRSAPVATPQALRTFVREVGYPVVVKPVNGVASRDTWILRTESDTSALLAAATPDSSYLSQMFAEEFIEGMSPPSPQLGDYVSAEIFRAPGSNGAGPATVEAFVTDRLVPAWPCRETGLLLPSQLPESVQDAALAVASRALETVRAGVGAFHLELKPRLPAPEIVEINGRLGGFIARLARYGAGADLGRLALACTVGHPYELGLRWERCVVSLMFQAPAAATRITAAPSRREITRLTGVIAVDSVAVPGPAPDWLVGTNEAVARLWIAGDDHAELFARLAIVAEFLAERFTFTDVHGNVVKDQQWLEAICRG